MADVSRQAGRGALYITAAKGYFLGMGALLVLVLPRILGPEGVGLYGKFSIVMGTLAVLNMVMITGALQAASRFASQMPDHPWRVARPMLKVQSLLGVTICAALVLAAPELAYHLGDPSLVPYLRLGSAVTLGYSFYALFVGIVNGQKRFHVQAGLDAGFATVKVASILGLVALGYGVMGAVAGFVATVALFLALSVWAVFRSPVARNASAEEVPSPGVRDILRFVFPVLGYALVLNLILQADLFLVKSLLGEGGDYAFAGLYAAAVNLSRLPYQATMAITLVMFPFVSAAVFSKDREGLRRTVSGALRYALVGSALFAAPFMAAPDSAIRLVFPPEYAAAAQVLRFLALGYVAFTLLGVGMAMLNAAGTPWQALAVAGITLAASVGLNVLLIPRMELPGAGVATASAFLLGCVVVLIVISSRFHGLFPIRTLLRVAVGLTASALIAMWLPNETMFQAVFRLAVAGMAFPVVLVVTGEIDAEDRRRLRKIMPF